MKTGPVNINFAKMAVAFRKHVRLKALNAGSYIVYLKNGQIVEENPKDSSTRISKNGLSVTE
jgi:ribosomal protein L18E